MMKKLLALFSALLCVSAHAGYAQAVPPSGWSPGNYAPSANDSVFGRVIHSPNGPTTIVGGQAVKMPAAYRLAANAPRIAAGIIFANPYVRAGAAIASWLGVAGVVWNAVDNVWETTEGDPPPNVLYRAQLSSGAWTESIYPSLRAAAIAGVDWRNPVFQNCTGGPTSFSCTVEADAPWGGRAVRTVSVGSQSCPVGWNPTTAGCVQNSQPKRLTEDEFKDRLTPKPMPERVPLELPQPTPLPIEHQPFINPLPGPDPQHVPRFVPSGDPVPNPNYDPNAAPGPNNQPYTQPGTRIVPSPTPSQPWRVDHQPVNRPQADAKPKPNPDAEPGTNPSDKPDEDQDLCVKNPDIAACENGDINDVSLPEIPKLYERKYPDGLVGIWNQKSDQIKQTSAFSLAAQLMPTGLVSGTCPSWPLALDFSWWASYGEYDVAPPCWIWEVAKTIIIISALMLARSLIFGG